MELVRNKHFRAYIERITVECLGRHHGMDIAKATAKFNDEYDDDANMLVYVLNGTYPNTKRVGDGYHFVTREDIVHTDIAKGTGTYLPGRMTLVVDPISYEAKMTFDNKNFSHGHINEEGNIICYGGYNRFSHSIAKIGLSGALMDMYNFARVSSHDTHYINPVD